MSGETQRALAKARGDRYARAGMDARAEQAADPTVATRAADKRRHDVCFTTSARLSFTAHRGVTVAPDGIAWTFDGKPDGAPFKNIVDVSLQTGPGAHRLLRICQITFADRYQLLITNGNAFGVPTQAQRAAYRGFMHDLHARLAAHATVRDGPPIEFKAGFAARLYFWLTVRVAFWALVFVGAPLAVFLMTGETKPFLLLLAALFVGALLWRMVHSNAPRSYDPAKLPNDLVD